MSVLAVDVRRDARVISLIGTAHFTSHFFHLALPPLFPLVREELGVSWIALGLVVSVFYGASGIGQTIAGFLVDRFGAPRVLVVGIALLAGATAAAGVAPSYWALVAVAMLAGLGNSVFHPADYAIINGAVDPRRIGRAYSVHSVCGNLGWAVAPVVVVGLASWMGWRAALVTVGVAGIVAAGLIATQATTFGDHRVHHVGGVPRRRFAEDVRMLLSRPILAAFAFFAILATALIGLQTFAVTAMIALYDVPLSLASGALTAFLLGSAAGILTGGVLADRAPRHERVAAGGLLTGAAFVLVVGSGATPAALLPAIMGLAGFATGVTSPSRDVIVRSTTPSGASGKVFGFVYSGLDLGSSLTPLLFGWLLDRGQPKLVFVAAAALTVLGIVTVLQIRRRGAGAATARA